MELICCAIGIAQTQAVQLEDALEMDGGSGNITRQVSSAFMDRAGMFGVHLLRVLATLAVPLTHGALQHWQRMTR